MSLVSSLSRRGRIALGAAAVLAVSAATVAVTQAGAPSTPAHPAVSSGTAVPDERVAGALTDAGCPQMLERGPVSGPRRVVLLDRTGEMAGAGLPAVVLTAISSATAADALGSLTLVLVGGEGAEPTVVLDGAALVDPSAGDDRRQRIVEALPACLDAALGALPTPATPGSDVLYAEQSAARLARSALEGGSADVGVYLVTDGAANAGLLDLREQGFPVGEPGGVVRRVQAAGDLPDLADLQVVLVGIGQQLQEGQRGWLEKLHLGLCTAAGGVCEVSADQVPITTDTADGPRDPALSTLEPVPGAPSGTVSVDPAAFAADSTDLLDPASVEASLRPLVRALADDPGAGLRLVGHACDDGSPQAALVALSVARAETIAALVRPVFPAGTRLEVVGVGGAEPVAVPVDAGAERACELQRTVVLSLLRPA